VRLKVPVRVPHDSDLDQALALMREAAGYPERVLVVPAPNALIMAFGETAIELELRFWIEDAQNGVHNVKSQVLYEIWRLFRQDGIEIPYPKRDLYVRSDRQTSGNPRQIGREVDRRAHEPRREDVQ
jgi:small-conductance mechanosensitive channel